MVCCRRHATASLRLDILLAVRRVLEYLVCLVDLLHLLLRYRSSAWPHLVWVILYSHSHIRALHIARGGVQALEPEDREQLGEHARVSYHSSYELSMCTLSAQTRHTAYG